MPTEITPDTTKSPDTDWETCPLHILLVRIMRLNHALHFCRGLALHSHLPTQRERDRLIEIYTRRNKAANLNRQ